MTVMGNDFLSEIILKNKVVDPALILQELDKNLQATFRRQSASDGMDISIISYCTQRRVLSFAGAKSPLYLIHNEIMPVILVSLKADCIAKSISLE